MFGTEISWKANIQVVLALSTTKAEFMAVTEAVKVALLLKGVLVELGFEQKILSMFCDSQGAIHFTKHKVFHEKSKHIDVRMHFVRVVTSDGIILVQKISIDHNHADMLTKSVPSEKFDHYLELINLVKH